MIDTQCIRSFCLPQVHPVSDFLDQPTYHFTMEQKIEAWKAWGARLKRHCKNQGLKNSELAESLGLAESTIRSWMNGTRPLNLVDFFRLCEVASASPVQILFGGYPLTEKQREQLGTAVIAILDPMPALNIPPKHTSSVKTKTKPHRLGHHRPSA